MEIKTLSNKIPILRVIGLSIFALCLVLSPESAVFAADEQVQEAFLVEKSYDFYGRDQTAAFLMFESENAHFYFDKEVYSSLDPAEKLRMASLVATLGGKFDEVIYPETKDIFGDEWNPGIDGDEKIYIFLTRMNYGVGGYFNPVDEYFKSQVVDGRSNEREMIYLNIDYLDKYKTEGFLAHELQHMIYWNEKTRVSGVSDDIWINEGRSELASSIIEDKLKLQFSDGVLSSRKRDFLSSYDDSIAGWSNLNADYASASIFMQYVKERAGTEIFRQMNETRKAGMNNLNYILERERGTNLAEIFTDWTIANYINDASRGAKYGYQSENLKDNFNVTPNPIYDVDGDGTINLMGKLENWSVDYFEVDLGGKEYEDIYLEMDFNGDDEGVFSLPMVINYEDESREITSMELSGKQDGHREEITRLGRISSIVFILGGEKIPEALKDNQAEEHPFFLDIKLTPLSDKVRSDGTLVRAAGDEKVYIIEESLKRWITDSATFVAKGYDWNSVITISKTELGIYGDGKDITGSASMREGSLVMGSSSRVYLIEGGKRRWVRDERTFSSLGYDWNGIVRISDQELLRYVEGQILAKDVIKDGMLVRGLGPEVYLLHEGEKCHIVSPQAFAKNNFKWSSIVATSDEVIASYPDGPDID
jgi:hypothetical protein